MKSNEQRNYMWNFLYTLEILGLISYETFNAAIDHVLVTY